MLPERAPTAYGLELDEVLGMPPMRQGVQMNYGRRLGVARRRETRKGGIAYHGSSTLPAVHQIGTTSTRTHE
jgi:hypothetical protein